MNTGAALYFIASASAEAFENPPLMVAVVSMSLAVAAGWGSLVLVIGLSRIQHRKAISAESGE